LPSPTCPTPGERADPGGGCYCWARSERLLKGGGDETAATIGGTEMRVSLSIIAAAASMAFAAVTLTAQSLNIDLGVRVGKPSSGFGAAAGQPGAWNTVGLGATDSLVELSGVPSAVDATVTADTHFGWYPDCAGDVSALVGDNIFTQRGPWSVVLQGLLNAPYRVFLYGPRNPSVPTGAMTVNGLPVASVSGDSCDPSSSASHTTVDVTVTDGVLTIIGEPTEASPDFAGLAGVQVKMLLPLRPLRRALKGGKVQ